MFIKISQEVNVEKIESNVEKSKSVDISTEKLSKRQSEESKGERYLPVNFAVLVVC